MLLHLVIISYYLFIYHFQLHIHTKEVHIFVEGPIISKFVQPDIWLDILTTYKTQWCLATFIGNGSKYVYTKFYCNQFITLLLIPSRRILSELFDFGLFRYILDSFDLHDSKIVWKRTANDGAEYVLTIKPYFEHNECSSVAAEPKMV